MPAKPRIVAVDPMIQALDLCLADESQHGRFQSLAEATLASAVSAVDERYVSAKVKGFPAHEAAKGADVKFVQTP